MSGALHPAVLVLIDEMAQQLVADYLAPKPAPLLAESDARTNPAPFQALDEAA